MAFTHTNVNVFNRRFFNHNIICNLSRKLKWYNFKNFQHETHLIFQNYITGIYLCIYMSFIFTNIIKISGQLRKIKFMHHATKYRVIMIYVG